MPHNSGPTKRDLFPGHEAGKGDADRSPGWREGYDEVNWPHSDDGFIVIRPGVQRKFYGQTARKIDAAIHGD